MKLDDLLEAIDDSALDGLLEDLADDRAILSDGEQSLRDVRANLASMERTVRKLAGELDRLIVEANREA